jgi:hypothetical protein
MAKIILFADGDDGGLILTEAGVRSIPPFGILVRAQIKAVSQLATAIQDQLNSGSERQELAMLAARLANLAIQQVEAIIGSLDAEASLIVTNGVGGGFVCGTTGKPPIPLPRRPRELPSVANMLTDGVIDRSLLTFLDKAIEQGRSAEELFERPVEVARDLGLDLPERSAHALSLLAPSRVDNLEDPVAREVVTFFQRVLADGRYVDTWAIRPAAVSQSLDVQLSDPAVDRLITIGAIPMQPTKPAFIGILARIVIGVVVNIVVQVATEDDTEVVDRSGRTKF